MKFTLAFKTPDVTEALYAPYREVLADAEEMTTEEDQARINEAYDQLQIVQRVVEKYVKYGEAVKIEFDTETEEAKVLESK